MWLAWSLMNCVLKDSGRTGYVCNARSIKRCTSALPDSMMSIYTQYLNEMDTKCYFKDVKVRISLKRDV